MSDSPPNTTLMEPSLSVCLIARNEESSLPRALASVHGLAGEIIVADTGSTDRTRSIAEDFGAVVSDFPWCDDFSAARNFAVGQARGDWILWLDADEELLPGSEEELRGACAGKTPLHILCASRICANPGDWIITRSCGICDCSADGMTCVF